MNLKQEPMEIIFRTTGKTRQELINALQIVIERIQHQHKIIDFRVDGTVFRLELPLEHGRHGSFARMEDN
jgi:hypothetical protein